jgi:hypothetical protein
MGATCWKAARLSPRCRRAAVATTPNFIASHSFHSDLGLSSMTAPGQVANGRAWDTSNGLFGKWDPITYRYLTPAGDERLDMSTADWLMTLGARVVGGGPATTSRNGESLTTLAPDAASPETNI